MKQYYQNSIPVYQFNNLKEIQQESQNLYHNFFSGAGCFIVKGVFKHKIMTKYNEWCQQHFQQSNTHQTHPKQKDKWVINDLIERLAKQDSNLLLQLINNPIYHAIADSLLGFSRIGAFTTHWINPGGKRQLSHVDFPCHVGSGKFWDNNPEKLKEMFTPYQLNHILPYYSIQILIASDAMDQTNGSTEVVPYSHLIPDLDIKLHDPEFYQSMESRFINTKLNQGDIFVFNRRLCHRGGQNLSPDKRNSAIMQCVWLLGLGQHQFNSKIVEESEAYQKLSDSEKKIFSLRLNTPYPIPTNHH